MWTKIFELTALVAPISAMLVWLDSHKAPDFPGCKTSVEISRPDIVGSRIAVLICAAPPLSANKPDRISSRNDCS
jgi:hypothetical protein